MTDERHDLVGSQVEKIPCLAICEDFLLSGAKPDLEVCSDVG
jgi:hypothetical protein